ncbi:glycosyltransferase [Pseudomonas sp. LAM2023]|uniref:glycosyltransferase n=1 Tax=Pseudomonas sp. LAM2023 TaxID=2800477 RepID=UPI00190BE5E0|nr:glycosyltransferase [Pseudomonas sp. LAM2023]
MKIPRIAVLLAAYNGMQWLPEQVASILEQDDVDVTLFISVDRSDDGTEAWCETIQENTPAVQVLPFGQRFGGAGKNFFRLFRDVDLSPFDAVSLADQDDIWYPDKLARGYQHIASGNAAYSSNVVAFWPDGREVLVEKHQPQVKFDYLFEAAGPGCTYLLSSALASQFKAFLLANWQEVQEVALHDWLIYAYARSQHMKWFIDPQASMRYRQHASNQVGVNAGIVAMRARLSKVLSGWWLHQSMHIASLVGMEKSELVAGWAEPDVKSLLRLAVNARQCRRRNRDKVYFFGLCLILVCARLAGQRLS